MDYRDFTFDQFVSLAPNALQERVRNLVKVPQRDDYHPEGNVWNHEMIVFNRLREWTKGDVKWLMVALFHDIGKDKTTKPQPRHGKWLVAYGHENVSARVVDEFKGWVAEMGVSVKWLKKMVKDHMRPNSYNQMRRFKQEQMQAWPHFDDLMFFNKADKMTKPTPNDWQNWMD